MASARRSAAAPAAGRGEGVATTPRLTLVTRAECGLCEEMHAEMASALGADSLRYLPVESVARAIGLDHDDLCQACITGEYPTVCGQRLAELAQEKGTELGVRTYERIAARR